MAAATDTTVGTIVLSGDLHGADATAPELSPTGVTPGVYSTVQKMYVDTKGRITNIVALTDAELADIAVSVGYATTIAKGVVQVGTGLNADSNGVLTASTATGTATLYQNNLFTKAQVSQLYSAVFAASYTPDFSLSNTISMVLEGNITINAPTNAIAGGVYTLLLIQDATGNRVLSSIDAVYKTNSAVALSTAPGAVDVVTFICKNSTTFYVMLSSGYA